MIGRNQLLLNEATVVAALQEYFDKRYTEGVDPGPKVVNVTFSNNHLGNHYQVTLEGRQP